MQHNEQQNSRVHITI